MKKITLLLLISLCLVGQVHSEEIDRMSLVNTDILAFYSADKFIKGEDDGESMITLLTLAVSNASKQIDDSIQSLNGISDLLPEEKEKNDKKITLLSLEKEEMMDCYYELKAHVNGDDELPLDGIKNRLFVIKRIYSQAMSANGEEFDLIYRKINNYDFD